jgi:hypothetical protein
VVPSHQLRAGPPHRPTLGDRRRSRSGHR